MASLESVLEIFQLLNYIQVAAAAVVCYDYILTFPREVELIWTRPWSVLSTLFVMVRYVGVALAVISGLGLGTGILYMTTLVGEVLLEIVRWTKLIYIVMADVITIIRVSVMFNQRERTGRILFFLYSIVTVNTIVFTAYWYGPQSSTSVTSIPLPDGSGTICFVMPSHSPIAFIYDGVPRTLFGILLLALAIYRFTVHSIETRRMVGKPRTNEYMKLLLEHNVIYFFFNFAYEALAAGTLVPTVPVLYVVISELYLNAIPFIIYPRLVLIMKDHRATSGGLHVGSEGSSGHPHSYGNSVSPSVPMTESSGEHDRLEGTSSRVS